MNSVLKQSTTLTNAEKAKVRAGHDGAEILAVFERLRNGDDISSDDDDYARSQLESALRWVNDDGGRGLRRTVGALLASDVVAVRKQAARLLAFEDVDDTAPLLVKALAVEADDDVRIALGKSIGAKHHPAFDADILPLLNHADASMRRAAILALSPAGVGDVLGPLLRAIGDADGAVSDAAINKITSNGFDCGLARKKSTVAQHLDEIDAFLSQSTTPPPAASWLSLLPAKRARAHVALLRSAFQHTAALLRDGGAGVDVEVPYSGLMSIVARQRLVELAPEVVEVVRTNLNDRKEALDTLLRLNARAYIDDIAAIAKKKPAPVDADDGPERWAQIAAENSYELANKIIKAWSKPMPTSLATVDDALARLKAAELPKVATKLKTKLLPCVRLAFVPSDDDAIAVGAAKLGGAADLPATTTWPVTKAGHPLSFLLQLPLASVAALPIEQALPKDGWLSFFVDDDDLEGGGRDVVRVVLTPPGASLVRKPRPASSTKALEIQPCSVRFDVEMSFPSTSSAVIEKCGFDEDVVDDYGAFLTDIGQGELSREAHQLFGWPTLLQGDDLSSKGSTLLLQLSSSELAQLHWGDAGRVYVFVDSKRLAKGNVDDAELHLRGS